MCHPAGTRKCDKFYMKICPRCKENKPRDSFFKNKGRAGAYCKPCQQAYVREHYRRTKGAYNSRRYILHAKYVKRNRSLVIEYLKSHPCVDCGEEDLLVLDFDHVSGTKLSSISQMIRNGKALVHFQAEMAKCVVRCANCHRRKTAAECRSYRITPWLYDGKPAPQAGEQQMLWDGRGSNPEPIA